MVKESISKKIKKKNLEFQKQEKKITKKFNKAINGLALINKV